MTKRERVETLINYYADGNKTLFANKLGITPQTLSNWMKRDTLDFELVHKKCNGLNGDWLLSGEGEMIVTQKVKNSEDVNKELLLICKNIIENYKQRDNLLERLFEVVKNLEE